ncbi:MAG: RHS repeat-associated core domain-containing protein [Acidobacteriota bacterium]
MKRLALLAGVLLVLAVPVPMAAQQDPLEARGFDAAGTYDFSGIDSVNLFTGALQLTLPIGPRTPVSGGLSYGLTLAHSSKLWDLGTRRRGDYEMLEAYPNREGNAGLGWMLSVGGALLSPSYTIDPGPWRFVGEDGSVHAFYQSLHLGEPTGTGYLYTRDGSYLRLSSNGAARVVEFPDGTIRTFVQRGAKGRWGMSQIRDRFGNSMNLRPVGNSWVLTDSEGRRHEVVFQTSPTTGEARVDRVKLEAFGGGTAIYEFSYQTGRVIDRHCDDFPQSSYPPGDTDPTGEHVRVDLLTSVKLPDGSKWEMPSYYTTCDALGGEIAGLPGAIRQLRVPTRGLYEWTYETVNLPARQPHVGGSLNDQETLAVATKRRLEVNGGCADFDWSENCAWTYTYEPKSIGGDFGRETTVTSPAGDDTVHHFTANPFFARDDSPSYLRPGWDYGMPYRRGQSSNGKFLSQQIYDGKRGSGGTLLREVYVRWERDKLKPYGNVRESSDWYDSNRRPQSQRVEYKANGNRVTESVSSEFDGLGHYRKTVTSGSSDLGPVRTVTTAYNPSRGIYEVDPITNQTTSNHSYAYLPVWMPWLLNTYTSTVAQQGNSTVRTDFCFESNTGFLKRQRRFVGPNPSARDVITERTRNAAGNVTQERTYGGDRQSVNLGANLCTLSLPSTPAYRLAHTYQHGQLATSRYLRPGGAVPSGAENYFLVEREIDESTGAVKSTKDPAGVKVHYSYDPLGRLTRAEPTAGNGAWIEVDYLNATPSRAARVSVYHRANGQRSGARLTEREVYFSAWGRVWRDLERLPSGVWSESESAYYPNGWKRSQTPRREEPEDGDPDPETLYSNYDPFGRPKRLTLPDGKSVTLAYRGVRAIARTVKVATGATGGETSQTTTEIYDRYGRLTEVQEPSGAGGAMVATRYTYDVADRLTGVSTPIGDGRQQERAFAYDGRGFLLSEQHPELGVAGEGTRRYEGYDAMGNAHRQYVGAQNGLFDLAFTYDLNGRLTEIREHGGLRRPLKEFVYGAEQSSHNRSKGKVLQAIRHNYHVPPWNPQAGEVDISVTETYTYGGTAGRVSRRTTAASGFQSFSQSWSWNDLGLPTFIGYPQCTFYPCTGSSNSRTVVHAYGRGRLTAVPGYADSISYHDNGMLAEIEYPNEVVYFQDRDPHGMSRPGSIGLALGERIVEPELYLAAGAATHNLRLEYDGSGNIKTLGPERYRYDAVSRVVRGSLGAGAYQQYTFDRFGNIGTILTQRGHGPERRTYAIDPETNRLASETYDADGNQRTYGTGGLGFSYTWDPLSKMKSFRRNNGSQNEIYVYTADDERLFTLNSAVSPVEETWTLRDLGGKVLRTWANVGGSAGTWSHEKDHVYRDGQLLASWSPTDGPRYYHLDHLGSPRLITDRHGQRVDGATYFPFGEQAGLEEPSNERMRFTGHERDHHGPGQLDDLDYMHARYCNPMTGRFLSVDPVIGQANRPQSWNMYAYALGNPLKWVDPTGETVNLSSLSEEERALLIADLNAFTGNTYGVDENLNLVLEEAGAEGSQKATNFLNDLIGSDELYSVEATTRSSHAVPEEGRALVNFQSFDDANYRSVDPRTFNLGSTLIHELYHASSSLHDTLDGSAEGLFPLSQTWTGPVVDFVNEIRSERGLPLRDAYVSVPAFKSSRSIIPFTHVKPKKPGKRVPVTRVRPN